MRRGAYLMVCPGASAGLPLLAPGGRRRVHPDRALVLVCRGVGQPDTVVAVRRLSDPARWRISLDCPAGRRRFRRCPIDLLTRSWIRSSTLRRKPRSRGPSASIDGNTMIARIFSVSTAAFVLSLSPWTVIKLTPRSALATPCLTVSPMSNILPTRNIVFSLLRSSWSSPPNPAVKASHVPSLRRYDVISSRDEFARLGDQRIVKREMSRCRNFLGPSPAVDGSSILLGEFGPTIAGTMAPSRGCGHNCRPSRRAALRGTWPH